MATASARRRIFLIADVDDNIIDTTRTVAQPTGTPVAWDESGNPRGFLTPKQDVLLGWLQSGCEVVPNTGRSLAELRAVKLPFRRYSITCFGGTICGAAGRPLRRWRQQVIRGGADTASPLLPQLAEVMRGEAKRSIIDLDVRVIPDCGIDMFLAIRHKQRNLDELAYMRRQLLEAAPSDWAVYLNGNFLVAVPPSIGKKQATAWFIENVVPKNAVVIGSGDSASDVPFISICDYAMMPVGSQSFESMVQAVGQGCS